MLRLAGTQRGRDEVLAHSHSSREGLLRELLPLAAPWHICSYTSVGDAPACRPSSGSLSLTSDVEV